MPARIKNRLWVCLCATMLLVGIDIGFFGFSYAMPFVDAIDFVRLALLALCVARPFLGARDRDARALGPRAVAQRDRK